MIKIIIIFYIVIINSAGFMIMEKDKGLARVHKRRVSEKTLWVIAFFGGALGMTAGMNVFRHKTKHLQFKWGLPILMIIDLFLFSFIIAANT